MRCKVCREKFEPKYFLQKTCLKPNCILEYSRIVKANEWKEKKKTWKEQIKTRQQHLKECQKVFNQYIRLRDERKGCISCGCQLTGKYDAGHFAPVGSCPSVRFNEDNVHGQCVFCNRHKHGNLIEYRINLIKRIGIERVKEVERLKNEELKLTIPEIILLKDHYKQKIKNFKP